MQQSMFGTRIQIARCYIHATLICFTGLPIRYLLLLFPIYLQLCNEDKRRGSDHKHDKACKRKK